MSRPDEMLELTRDKLGLARQFFEEGKMADTVLYIWQVFENCLNIVKDLMNNRPLYEHKPKIGVFQLYHSPGIFKKDYAPYFERLESLRVTASFGAYSREPKIPDRTAIEHYLRECEALFAETERHMVQRGRR